MTLAHKEINCSTNQNEGSKLELEDTRVKTRIVQFLHEMVPKELDY